VPHDDWLGDVFDVEWSDEAEPGQQPPPTPARQGRRAPEGSTEPAGSVERPVQGRHVTTIDARRATVERRRAVAALVLLLLVAVGAATAVLLLRKGEDAPATVTESQTLPPPAPSETEATPPPPSATPSTTTPTENASTFTLPEGTKLQQGESSGESDLTVSTDPALVEELQRGLVTAGFDPGTPDGTFGPKTEEAVVAFQQANGLSPDGIVGPETAAALNQAIARG
jgi:hypothetical protein